MITFFVNIFAGSTFGAVPDDTEGFKLKAVRLNDVAVIDRDGRERRTPFSDLDEIGSKGFGMDSFREISGKAVDGIDLLDGSWSWATISVRRQLPVANMP